MSQIEDLKQSYLTKARELIDSGNKSEAILYYFKILDLDPIDLVTHYRLGLVYHDLNEFQKALDCYKKVTDNAPDFVDAILASANATFSLGHTEDALALYESALSITPEDPQIHFILGAVHSQLGDLVKSIDFYQNTLDKQPDHILAAQNLASIYFSMDQDEEALEILEPFAAHTDNFPDLCYKLASYYYEKEDFVKALEYFRKAYKIDSSIKDALYKMSICYFLTNDFNQAEINFRKLLKLFPPAQEIYFYLARVYDKKEDFELAKENYEKAIEMNPKNFFPLFSFAEMLYQTKQFSRAKREFEKCEKLELPDNVADKVSEYLKAIEDLNN
jgi:tetratricopeptide (TPR) repeat protein